MIIINKKFNCSLSYNIIDLCQSDPGKLKNCYRKRYVEIRTDWKDVFPLLNYRSPVARYPVPSVLQWVLFSV